MWGVLYDWKMGVDEKGDGETLPGFRFHPTDEELVGFYLRRKVENKPIRLELIKHIDIYKFDPWDLPRVNNVGEKEWYFYCMRGRKYRNSIRPNRVTGSGFWKATGIDKPVYSDNNDCIGLKKSLVYYLGSAGKGSKTDWMMHEFRLPTNAKAGSTDDNSPQQPEVWTLCRIFKRTTRQRQPMFVPNQKPVISLTESCSNTSSLDSDHSSHHNHAAGDYLPHKLHEPQQNHCHVDRNPQVPTPPFSCTDNNFPHVWNMNGGDYFIADEGSWDELRSVVQGYSEHQ